MSVYVSMTTTVKTTHKVISPIPGIGDGIWRVITGRIWSRIGWSVVYRGLLNGNIDFCGS
jgi:mannose/fructose/N-acetylgalactosamine-specific phosphotransferase system component IID